MPHGRVTHVKVGAKGADFIGFCVGRAEIILNRAANSLEAQA
jgi:hypothetical protein